MTFIKVSGFITQIDLIKNNNINSYLIAHSCDNWAVPVSGQPRDGLQCERTSWSDESNDIVAEVHIGSQSRRATSRTNWITGKVFALIILRGLSSNANVRSNTLIIIFTILFTKVDENLISI